MIVFSSCERKENLINIFHHLEVFQILSKIQKSFSTNSIWGNLGGRVKKIFAPPFFCGVGVGGVWTKSKHNFQPILNNFDFFIFYNFLFFLGGGAERKKKINFLTISRNFEQIWFLSFLTTKILNISHFTFPCNVIRKKSRDGATVQWCKFFL